MENIRPDILQKLKEAIAAKLTEIGTALGVTHDNELPDYIMVLLANKKTRRQIENDLQLFLAGGTSVFTSWLINVIKKLETLPNRQELQICISENDPIEEPSVDAGEQKHTSPMVAQDEPMSMSEGEEFSEILDVEKDLVVGVRNGVEIEEECLEHLKKNLYKRPTQTKNVDKSAFKGNRRDFSKITDAREIINAKMFNTDVEMDDDSPSQTKDRLIASVMKVVDKGPKKEKEVMIPSMVRVTPRPVRPPESQPSTNLILKAVKDAEKSVATVKPIQKMREAILEQRMKRAYKTEPAPPPIHLKSKRKHPYAVPSRLSPANVYSLDELEEIEVTVKNTDITERTDDEGEFKSIRFDGEAVKVPVASRLGVVTYEEVENPPAPPKKQFDRSRLGPRVSDVDSDSPRDLSDSLVTSSVDDLVQSTDDSKTPESETSVINKIRCKFWPNCHLGESCRFHHPTVACRVFPKCKFGDNCVYIHPNCKFGAQCLNITCVYSHAHATKARRASLQLTMAKQQRCMFFPVCSNPVCPFVHVRPPCRFGSKCLNKSCEYEHVGSEAETPTSTSNPFKWCPAPKKDP